MLPDIERACAYCAVSIAGSHGRRKFCSQLCKNRKYMVLEREGTHPVAGLVGKCCQVCNKSMAGKRPHAVYCNRSCKNRASELRRNPRSDSDRYQREKVRRIAYQSEYLKRNPDVAKRAKNKRRARKAAAGVFVVTSKDWQHLLARQRGECFYCGLSRALSMDHVIPLSRGGRHSIGNIVAACLPCNSSKRTRYITEWRQRGGTRTTAPAHDRAGVAENGGRQLVPA